MSVTSSSAMVSWVLTGCAAAVYIGPKLAQSIGWIESYALLGEQLITLQLSVANNDY
jgi:hypothetical protein